MTRYETITEQLRTQPKAWLVTGAAGFIGSNLVETLLRLDQSVVGLDNFSTGKPENLAEVQSLVSESQWARFRFVEGDTRDLQTCHDVCQGVDYVLHQAALGSVPRSLADPGASHDSNVNGMVNMLVAARDAEVACFVYASSSSVYGDHPGLPKEEDCIGECLSPYAVTKRVGELYAKVFARSYGLASVGLRYFNVFGPRQDPDGPYAAVIPKWVAAMLTGDEVFINGDGSTSRDFCYIANTVQANILAATSTRSDAANCVYNVALHARTTLNELYGMIRSRLEGIADHDVRCEPVYRDFRPGDVLHSEADIASATELLGYEPTHTVSEGLDEALAWYVESSQRQDSVTA